MSRRISSARARVRSCCWRRSALLGIKSVSGVRGGGWKGDAVRRGVKISEEDDDHGLAEGIFGSIFGSVKRR